MNVYVQILNFSKTSTNNSSYTYTIYVYLLYIPSLFNWNTCNILCFRNINLWLHVWSERIRPDTETKTIYQREKLAINTKPFAGPENKKYALLVADTIRAFITILQIRCLFYRVSISRTVVERVGRYIIISIFRFCKVFSGRTFVCILRILANFVRRGRFCVCVCVT